MTGRGLFSACDDEGHERWFLAQRLGKSCGEQGDDWFLYECTLVRPGFETLLDPPDPARVEFVEEGCLAAAVEPVRERIDDAVVMIALFTGANHRRIARTFFA